MNQYVTGGVIRRLREKRGLTQARLAEHLCVSDKTVSKWETGKGYPDITLLEPIAELLGVSVTELLSGTEVENANRSGNMRRTRFYVCPVCGNILHAMGEAVISCHGITLPPLEPEEADDDHPITVERVEDEYYVTVPHEMTRQHYISFIAALSYDGLQLVKTYPQWDAQAYFKVGTVREIFCLCNRDGLFRKRI